jgi:AraC family transcriptional regulator of adaptative response / DNA-3-methyladenine glycosylase II
VRTLAGAVNERALDFDAPLDEVTSALSVLPGFDASSAQYFALRALGDPDAFPAAAIASWATARAGAPSDAHALAARAESWRPWRSYAAVLLSRARVVGAGEARRRSIPVSYGDNRPLGSNTAG